MVWWRSVAMGATGKASCWGPLLLLLLLQLLDIAASTRWSLRRDPDLTHRSRGRHRRKDADHGKIPEFDDSSPTQINTQLGSTAYLPCKIHNLGDQSVSWVRNRDAHIVSVGRYTFIADERFTVWHEAAVHTWTLQIKFVNAMDGGNYECQVSTEPKLSRLVHLNVISPRVTIAEGSELHVRSGSTVTIKCIVSKALHPPTHVFWYHEMARVPEDAWRGIHQTPLTEVSPGVSEAALTITSVSQSHAGNYTCAPAALTPVSATLHVLLNGERPAAMQHGTSGTQRSNIQHLLTPLLLLLLLLSPLRPGPHLLPVQR